MIPNREIRPALVSVFSRIPGAVLESFPDDLSSGRIDALLKVSLGSSLRTVPLILEVVSQGHPRMLRLACSELKAAIRRLPPEQRPYPIILAPYITERGIGVCAEEEVGCIDLAGNCRIAPGEAFVEIRGMKNRLPATRDIKSTFSPKSGRIARVLLSDIDRWWQVQELAKAARVSIGLVSGIRQRLLNEELVVGKGKSVKVNSPTKLLRLWSSHYTYKRSKIREFYTFEKIPQFESRVADYCKQTGLRYGLALFSGAARVAPHVRYGKAFVYVMGDLEAIGSDLGLKSVASGPNVALLEPFDEGILFGSREIDGAKVVSDIQLYLDLIGYEARGEEAAEFLMQEVLEPQWTHP